MASNLSKRLDRLERLMRERLSEKLGPIYLRDGEAFADGIDPERVIIIKRVYVDPPAREEDALPEAQAAVAETKRPKRFSRPIEYPNLGIV